MPWKMEHLSRNQRFGLQFQEVKDGLLPYNSWIDIDINIHSPYCSYIAMHLQIWVLWPKVAFIDMGASDDLYILQAQTWQKPQ